MGKETKIGLAIIGVLLSVFGVLLFRHLSISRVPTKWDDENHAPVEPLAAEPAGDKPNVVVAQKDSAAGGIDDSMWGTSPPASSSSPEVPPASYMPAPEAGADESRYTAGAEDLEPAAGDTAAAAEAPVGSSPFQNREPVGHAADEPRDPAMPAELPRAESGHAHTNPLRQLNAELPLDAPQQTADAAPTDEPTGTLADETADPYADELPAQPGDQADSAQPLHGTQSPDDLSPAGPQGIGGSADEPRAEPFDTGSAREPLPANTSQDPFPDAFDSQSSPAPAAEDYRQPRQSVPGEPSAGMPPRAMQNDWQRGAAGDRAPDPVRQVPIENGMYTVQPNDTLWSISEKVYGTGGYFKALAEHNRSTLPRSSQLSVGMQVAAPPVEQLEEDYPSLCPRKRQSALVQPRPAAAVAPVGRGGDVYVVEEGDTLFDIARYELGKASRWAEIYELNRDRLGEDFDYLRPGMELRLPANRESPESIGRGREKTYLR